MYIYNPGGPKFYVIKAAYSTLFNRLLSCFVLYKCRAMNLNITQLNIYLRNKYKKYIQYL